MKEAIVAKGPVVTIQNIPTPKPNADQASLAKFYTPHPLPSFKPPMQAFPN